jgi:polyphosphate kinase
VHVVYGIVGLKTHCKLSLVIRQEGTKLRRYCHIGTGNYNPKTARFYEDYGLLTAREAVGEDLTRLFNQLSGYAPEASFRSLLVSPNGVRDGLIERINVEIENHRNGRPSGIKIKVNSLVDEKIIDALYHASAVGVPIDIFVRGMCSLRPGVPGLSETVRVRSVLGRYLEHSRAFAFVNDGDPRYFIGSADMMHRNLDRRVEALVNLQQPDHLQEIEALFELAMSDQSASWHLDSNGVWTRHQFDASGKRLLEVQDEIMRRVAAKRGRG